MITCRLGGDMAQVAFLRPLANSSTPEIIHNFLNLPLYNGVFNSKFHPPTQSDISNCHQAMIFMRQITLVVGNQDLLEITGGNPAPVGKKHWYQDHPLPGKTYNS